MAVDNQSQISPQTRNAERHGLFSHRVSPSAKREHAAVESSKQDMERPTKWSLGVLNDPLTHEVPGSVLLLAGERNEPLGLRNTPARTSASSLPSQQPSSPSPCPRPRQAFASSDGKKKTRDGAIILEPQPDDSNNDPLNWPAWRRDAALVSLGLYCMVGGGMTPILAAGFNDVASTYHVTKPQVALTTGLYMMGLGIGSVIFSPMAILFGKRPVYLVSAIIFLATSVWCALSPSYISLLVARIIQGVSVSPVECLPSATIAEIFFLHERAFRIGIYTLLLLGGKNLIPLVSAVIIQSYGWRWVFWIVAMVVFACWVLLILFVPESFWDRTPHPKHLRSSAIHRLARISSKIISNTHGDEGTSKPADDKAENTSSSTATGSGSQILPVAQHQFQELHVGFARDVPEDVPEARPEAVGNDNASRAYTSEMLAVDKFTQSKAPYPSIGSPSQSHQATDCISKRIEPEASDLPIPSHPHGSESPFHQDLEMQKSDSLMKHPSDLEGTDSIRSEIRGRQIYTTNLKDQPPLTFVQQLKPFHGRLTNDNFFKVMLRPFILFAYPAVLWSAVVYACAVGWLIVLSESVAEIYRNPNTYNFSALSTGLIYLSPFVGGVLGTAVAGKVSDMVVRYMSSRNGGLYEPEFRLVMALPVAISTVIGLMGFGWSAQERDAWIVPTAFFGIISFGCSLGSTTAITFSVDSYRQYAGEALVTLNFSKNIFHGLVFSLFINRWLEHSGPKSVFVWLGVIQLILMTATIPMYIFGKRARMWTVRMNLMEKF